LIYGYSANLKMVQENFLKAINVFFEKGFCEDFDFLIEQTHKLESKADDTRYDKEVEALFRKSGDIRSLVLRFAITLTYFP